MEQITAKFWEEFVFEVILASIFPSANHRAESYKANAPGEGQHYYKCLLRVSVPGVVLFGSNGGLNPNFSVLWMAI